MASNVLDFARSGAAEIFDDRDVLLTRKETAEYLRVSVPTLERWARDGIGPKPRKTGRHVHYTLREVRAAASGGEAA